MLTLKSFSFEPISDFRLCLWIKYHNKTIVVLTIINHSIKNRFFNLKKLVKIIIQKNKN